MNHHLKIIILYTNLNTECWTGPGETLSQVTRHGICSNSVYKPSAPCWQGVKLMGIMFPVCIYQCSNKDLGCGELVTAIIIDGS